jgi:hypothetical protein
VAEPKTRVTKASVDDFIDSQTSTDVHVPTLEKLIAQSVKHVKDAVTKSA